jgi:hypothetical protein
LTFIGDIADNRFCPASVVTNLGCDLIHFLLRACRDNQIRPMLGEA